MPAGTIDILGYFDIKGSKGANNWVAKCPAHDDSKPSLTITETPTKYLVHCFAGCSTNQVLKSVGLEWSDLFLGDRERPDPCLMQYEYRRADGSLSYVVERHVGKKFVQRSLTPSGDWVWSMDGVEKLLYRLPDVLSAVKNDRWVFLVEGEKDVHTLEGQGFVATTSSGGVRGWRAEGAVALSGAKVAIIPDNDEPGRLYAEAAEHSLSGLASDVRVLSLPVPPKGDITDWFEMGHTRDDLKRLVLGAQDAPVARPLADVRRGNVLWLWEHRIPKNKLTVIGGVQGEGKSYLTLALLASLSVGRGVTGDHEPESSLVISWEDDPVDTIRPRAEQLGADLRRIHVWDANSEPFTLPANLPQLKTYISKHPGITTVVIDPLVSALGAADAYRQSEVRRTLGSLLGLGLTVIGITHLAKSNDYGNPLHRFLDSNAFTALARSVLLVENGCVKNIKSNVAARANPRHYIIDSSGFRFSA